MNDWGHSTLGLGPVGNQEPGKKREDPAPLPPQTQESYSPAAPRTALEEVLNPEPTRSFSGSGLEIASLSCPNCGDGLETISPAARTVSCASCGSVIDLQGMGIIGQGKKAAQVPWSAIRLGMTCHFKAVEYQVVGRVRYLSECYHWDEWMLLSRKGKVLWLAEDEGNFFLLDTFRPDGETDVDAAWTDKYVEWENGSRALVYDRGVASIIYVEGELTWRAAIGETVRFVDAKRRGTQFSCEIEEDEIKFFRGRHYTAEQVYNAFDLKEPVPYYPPEDTSDVDEDDYTVNWDAVPEPLTDSMKVLLLAGVIFFVAGFFFQADGIRLTGSAIAGTAAQLETIPESDTFTLDQVGEIYAVACSANLPRSTETWADMETALVDAETGEPVLVFQREFWLETGRDSDGDWMESDTGHMEYFKLDRKGTYRLRLEIESNQPGSSVHAEIRKGARDRSMVFYNGIVFLAVSILLFFGSGRFYRERIDTW